MMSVADASMRLRHQLNSRDKNILTFYGFWLGEG